MGKFILQKPNSGENGLIGEKWMMKFSQAVKKIPGELRKTISRSLDYTDLEYIEKICGIIFLNLCNQAEGVDKQNPFS